MSEIQKNNQMVIHRGEAEDFMPVLAIEQAVNRYNSVIEFTRRVLKPGRDYGIIPGTGGGKKNEDGLPSAGANTLLKPGAEKLCTLFGLSARFDDYRVTEDWERGLFYYAYKCILSRNGRDIAECIGSANSMEKKYRSVSRKCPMCQKETIFRSKPRQGEADQGWYCWKKKGGCGATFAVDDPAITDQKETTDAAAAADKINTLQKMAQKRAYVGAALLATNASEFFTQDMEDMQPVETIVGEEVTDAEHTTVSSVSPAQKFIEDWDRVSDHHGIPHNVGRDWMGVVFRRAELPSDLTKISGAKLAELLRDYRELSAEKLDFIKSAANKKNGNGPVTAEQVSTWDKTLDLLGQAMNRLQIDGVLFGDGIDKFLAGRSGDSVPVSERMGLVAAVNAGQFDFATGRIGRAAA